MDGRTSGSLLHLLSVTAITQDSSESVSDDDSSSSSSGDDGSVSRLLSSSHLQNLDILPESYITQVRNLT